MSDPGTFQITYVLRHNIQIILLIKELTRQFKYYTLNMPIYQLFKSQNNLFHNYNVTKIAILISHDSVTLIYS